MRAAWASRTSRPGSACPPTLSGNGCAWPFSPPYWSKPIGTPALTLDHLTAFAVTEDQEAQERVFGQLQDWQRSPDTIRRLLTHALVPATDRKAVFVGLDAYAAAGGTVQRDLFSDDRGGWIADPVLLERLVAERMEREAEPIRAEGWGWVAFGQEAQTAAWGLRRVWPEKVALSPEDEQHRDALSSRYDALADEHRSADDLPDDAAAELARIEAELAALEAKQDVYRAEDVARAGVVITLAVDGSLRIERGFVRPGDEAQSTPVTAETATDAVDGSEGAGTADGADEAPTGGTVTPIRGGAEPEDKAPALSAALLAELEAHRTAGLQAAIAGQSELALRVLLHALATEAFYQRYGDTVMSLHTYPPALASACPGIADSPARQVIATAEDAWRVRLPQDHGTLWGWLQDQDATVLLDLLALCVARTVTAGCRNWTTPEGSQCISAQVAAAAGLDMRQSWTATKEGYLGRVPKALILDAVREGAGASVAGRIAHSKKEVMVADAAQLLDGTGWLPAILRMPDGAARSYASDAVNAWPEPVPMAAE